MTSPRPTIIEVRDLVKHYPRVQAVNGVSFAIRQGTCFGLLGPNGAGKTTTVEMMEGVTPPTSGQILYKGEPLGARFRAEVGIQFQHTSLQDFLTVREVLALFQSFYPKCLDLDEVIELCDLREFLQRDHRKLSGGQRQRLLLAVSLVNDPEVIFLDEPTTGLDPHARRNFWELVHQIKARGKTVLLTTHYMEEAAILCDEIIILDRGRSIAQGAPQALLQSHFNDAVLELPLEDFAAAPETITLPVARRSEHVEITTGDVNAAVRTLLAAGVSLARLRIRQRTLEDLFLEITGREMRE